MNVIYFNTDFNFDKNKKLLYLLQNHVCQFNILILKLTFLTTHYVWLLIS